MNGEIDGYVWVLDGPAGIKLFRNVRALPSYVTDLHVRRAREHIGSLIPLDDTLRSVGLLRVRE